MKTQVGELLPAQQPRIFLLIGKKLAHFIAPEVQNKAVSPFIAPANWVILGEVLSKQVKTKQNTAGTIYDEFA